MINKIAATVFASLFFVVSIFASNGDIKYERRYVEAKGPTVKVYTNGIKGLNKSSVEVKKEDKLIAYISEQDLSKHYKVYNNDLDLSGHVRKTAVKVLPGKILEFAELPVKGLIDDSMIGVIDFENYQTVPLDMEISFMDKIQTNADKHQIVRTFK